MKQLYILSLLLISFFGIKAQDQPKGFHLERQINMRAILEKKPLIMGFSSVSEARTIINDILDVVNIQQNFTVVATTQVGNAAAVVYQNVRYILYNPAFINKLDHVAKDKWAAISVLGHEIGHHLLGHTLDGRGSQIPKELDADQFSGLVLRRMGATLDQAQLAMKLIASPYASASHPAEKDRLAAIARGWNSTTAQPNRGNTDVAISTPDDRRSTYPNTNPQTDPSSDRRNNYPATRGSDPSHRRDNYPSNGSRRNNPSAGDSRNDYPNNNSRVYGRRSHTIIYDIRFNGNGAEQYHITSANQVIRIRGNRAMVVAKIASTNNPRFPYVLYDDRLQIYVDRRGNLFTENSRRSIGYVARHA